MSSIIERERAKYENAWGLPAYAEHSPGASVLPIFLDMARPAIGSTVLDAGCGSGKGALALAGCGLRPTLCDLTADGLIPSARDLPFFEQTLWHPIPLTGFDYVYCCDVMEHIPTPFTMLVASRLLDVASEGAFFSISLVPDQFGAWVGEPLHATVQSFVMWRDQLEALGHVTEARDLLSYGCYYVVPR